MSAIITSAVEATLSSQPALLDIIACERSHESRCIGIRWAFNPALGYPGKGFILYRHMTESPDNLQSLGAFHLPESDSWNAFSQDVQSRQPACGPYFDSIVKSKLGYLLPLIRIIDPRFSNKPNVLIKKVANFFGQTHRNNAELAWEHWQLSPPPHLDTLLSTPATRESILNYYQKYSINFLMVLALRFEYAVLLGLATDDLEPNSQVVYSVMANWDGTNHMATSTPEQTNAQCPIQKPEYLNLVRVPGTVTHPLFSYFSNWEFPETMRPLIGDDNSLSSDALIPKVPATYTSMSWTSSGFPQGKLLGYEAVLFDLSKYSYGQSTAKDTIAPNLPSDAIFVSLSEGELQYKSNSNSTFIDRPGMKWPPLEGHYHYQVRGVDLLGNVSLPTRSTIRHYDELPPVKPRLESLTDRSISVPDGDQTINLNVKLLWDAPEDFSGPDANEFRFSVAWSPRLYYSIHIIEIISVSTIQVSLTIENISVPENALAGLKLITPGHEYFIVEHSTGNNAWMRIRKSGDRYPLVGTYGTVFSVGDMSLYTRVARMDKNPPIPVIVHSIISLDPLEMEIKTKNGTTLPTGEGIMIYMHLFRNTHPVKVKANGNWVLTKPAQGEHGYDAWNDWLNETQPELLLKGSPAIIYPAHETMLSITVPSSFTAGLMQVGVSCADDKDYIDSPQLIAEDVELRNLKGNESDPAELIYSVRTSNTPDAPSVNENYPFWTSSAADYEEFSLATVEWTPVSGAVRYEVWRAFEGALVASEDNVPHDQLRLLATQKPEMFEKRSDQVFSPRYNDEVPGRAPTRVLYQIRAVGINEEVGPASGVSGPFIVPDTRRPPAPNLVKVVVTDPRLQDRSIVVQWTQAGPLDDIQFKIYVKEQEWVLLITIDDPVSNTSGRYEYVHEQLIPGKKYIYKVQAVRVTLDPTRDGMTREIESPFSISTGALAITLSALNPPTSLAYTLESTGNVHLSWSNDDIYNRIEIRKKGGDGNVFLLLASLNGEEEFYNDPSNETGTYEYKIICFGRNKKANPNETIVVVIN